VCHASYPQDAGAKRPFAPLERFHVKQTLQDFDAWLGGNPPRSQLFMALAALLSREAIVRAMLDESESSSSSSAETGGSNATSISPIRR